MSDRSEQQRLLDEVLAESAPPDFRVALLSETLRQVRRRRQWRQARQAGGVLLVVMLVSLCVWQQVLSEKTSIVRPVAKVSAPHSYQLVETQPLPLNAVVTTENFASVKTISTAESVVQIATVGGGFRVINDEQLLALVRVTPAVLIRTGPNSEELIFANAEDRKRLWGN